MGTLILNINIWGFIQQTNRHTCRIWLHFSFFSSIFRSLSDSPISYCKNLKNSMTILKVVEHDFNLQGNMFRLRLQKVDYLHIYGPYRQFPIKHVTFFSRAFLKKSQVIPGHSPLLSLTPLDSNCCSSKMSSTGVKRSDGRVNDRIENYTKFWNADPLKEQEVDNAKRLDSYTEVVNGQLHLSFNRCLFHFSDGCVRLLRRRDRAVRVRLVTILPLLSFLQRRGFPCFLGPS